MSATVSPTHSASREIGTQASVAIAFEPGRSPTAGPIDVVARLPQLVARLGRGLPDERPGAEFGGDLAEALRLLLDRGRRPVELDEQGRRLLEVELRIGVAGLDLQRVEQLDAGDRNAALDGQDHRVAGVFDRLERADPAGNRLGNAMKLQRQLGDHAERPFRADEQPRQGRSRPRISSPGCPVLTTDPSGITAVRLRTLSRIVP